jgi:hypothetical protein
VPLPAIIIAAGLVVAQVSGAIAPAASLIVGIDNSIRAAIDLRAYVPQVSAFLHPKPPANVRKIVKKKP